MVHADPLVVHHFWRLATETQVPTLKKDNRPVRFSHFFYLTHKIPVMVFQLDTFVGSYNNFVSHSLKFKFFQH